MKPLPGLGPKIGKVHAIDVRQALRVAVGVALAFAAYRLLGLQQGYWAVFTVIIVMQGSIGSTLGAAVDRLVGTIAGAVLGGAATLLFAHNVFGIGGALVLVTLLTTLAASARPQLRVAPVTAAILLLAAPASVNTFTYVVDRVLEIAIGGFIGVIVSSFVFRAPSRELVAARSANVIERIADILRAQAGTLESGGELSLAHDYAALRQALTSVEQAMADADRERATGLAGHALSPAIPRTLWRVRNDAIQIVRTLEGALPASIAERLSTETAAMLRDEAEFACRCVVALRTGHPVERGDPDAAYRRFEEAFRGLREAGLIRPLDFDDVSRVFGLAFALDRLRKDLADLADRIDEVGTPATEA